MTGSPPAARYAPRSRYREGWSRENCPRSPQSHPRNALEELRKEVDEIIYLSAPSPFLAVGAHYADFGQLADAGVISLLEQRHRAMARSGDRTKRMKPAFRRSIQPKLAGLETLKLPNSAGD